MFRQLILIAFCTLLVSRHVSAQDSALEKWLDEVNVEDTLLLQRKFQESITGLKSSNLAHQYLIWGRFLLDKKFEHDSSKVLFKYAEETFRQTEDAFGLAMAKIGLSDIYLDQDRCRETIQLGQEAYKLLESIGDTLHMYWALSNIAIAHDYMSDNDAAVKYYKECLQINRALGNLGGEARVLHNLGGVYADMGDYKSSLDYYDKSLKIADSLKLYRLISSNHQGFYLTYKDMELISEGLFHLKEQMRYAIISGETKAKGFAHQDFSTYFINIKKYDSALIHAKKAMEYGQAVRSMQLIVNATERLRKSYAGLGNYEKAYELYATEVAMNDSLFNQDNARIIQSMKEQFETEKRDRELAQKNLELQTADFELNKQRNIQFILYGALAVLIAFLFGGYWVLMNRSRTNKLLAENNKQIEAHSKQIEQINETRTRWFLNVAHELRTPLTLIKGPVQKILSDHILEPQVENNLSMVSRNAESLITLVNEILDLSKLEEGKIVLESRPVNFNDLMLSITSFYEIKSHELGVEIRCEEVSQPYLNIDSDKIGKVISNLVSNALRYTPSGGMVEIKLSYADDIVIAISDTGEGIPQQDIPFIFDRFYQASNSNNSGGTGLGLALSKEIVELHEGWIEVVSELKKGTTFKIHLPISRKSSDLAYMESASEVIDKDKANSLSLVLSKLSEKPRVLVVEDNEDMRDYMESLMVPHFEVRKASNGQEGLLVLKNHKINLIISDMMMPVMDGYEFSKKVKDHIEWRHIPFIHLSAISDEVMKKRSLMVGVDDFLQKPFDSEELIIRVENLYRNSLSRHEIKPEVDDEISYDDKLLKKLKDEILDNLSDVHFNVLRLADCAAMSERQIYRYLKSTTGLTPLQFIQEIKLNKAMELVQKKVYTNSTDLATAVGFQQSPYFSSLFEKRFGKKPSAYLKVG